MPFIDWIASYDIGNPHIDAQHRHLVDLANTLHDAAKAGESTQVLGPALRALADYVRAHFRAEEELAARYAPDELPVQRATHANLVKKLKDVLCISNSQPQRASLELCALVKTWLIKHVLVVDKRLACHLPAAPAEGRAEDAA